MNDNYFPMIRDLNMFSNNQSIEMLPITSSFFDAFDIKKPPDSTLLEKAKVYTQNKIVDEDELIDAIQYVIKIDKSYTYNTKEYNDILYVCFIPEHQLEIRIKRFNVNTSNNEISKMETQTMNSCYHFYKQSDETYYDKSYFTNTRVSKKWVETCLNYHNTKKKLNELSYLGYLQSPSFQLNEDIIKKYEKKALFEYSAKNYENAIKYCLRCIDLENSAGNSHHKHNYITILVLSYIKMGNFDISVRWIILWYPVMFSSLYFLIADPEYSPIIENECIIELIREHAIKKPFVKIVDNQITEYLTKHNIPF